VATKIREANRYGPLSEERLARLESQLKARLPEDYRAFLLQSNGGRPAPCRFTFALEGEEQESILEWFFAVHDQPYEEDEDWGPDAGEGLPPYFAQPLDEVRKDFRSEMPKAKVLPVGRDPGGNLVCLGYAGKWAGRVYFFDHEMGMLVHLAESFTEFLAGLSPLPPGAWAPWLIVG
jgi:cell wall assembly regulator SMI1